MVITLSEQGSDDFPLDDMLGRALAVSGLPSRCGRSADDA